MPGRAIAKVASWRLLIRFSRRPFHDVPLLAIKLISENLRILLDKTYPKVCNSNECHKVNVTFFRACFTDKPHRRSNESEHIRTETNCYCTRKVRFSRKYALFLRTLRIMAFATHLLRVTIELMTAWIFIRVITHIMASFWRATIAPIIECHLSRVTRAITQVILAYRYCAFCDADFTARYVAYGDVHFAFDICALSQALLWRVIRVIRRVAFTRCYSAFGRGIFRAIISTILIFTCNQVQSIYASLNELKLIQMN